MSLKNDPIGTFTQAKALMARAIESYKPSVAVVRHEFRIIPIDQIRWLSAQRADIKVYGANQEETASIAGVGQALMVRGKGVVNYKNTFKKLRQALDPHYPYLQWYGGFGFDPRKTDLAWKRFDSSVFVIPRFELARDKDRMIFCCNLVGRIDKTHFLRQLNDLKAGQEVKPISLNVHNRRDLPDAVAWSRGVNTILKDIRQGKTIKVVLARKTDFDLKHIADPWLILHNLKKVTPNSYHFAFEFKGRVFLGASPERLYKRFGRMLWSEALAGTKPASVKPEVLLHSPKDLDEHQIVVNAIEQALKPLSITVRFDSSPVIKKLSNGIHLHTPIQAKLKDGVGDEDILRSLHPTPALGGQPTARALSLIRRLEKFGRGWYGAPVGYVGLDWAEFVVGIRSGLLYKKKLSVFAGAGIVKGSDPSDEWDEIENKISNFFRIIKQ